MELDISTLLDLGTFALFIGAIVSLMRFVKGYPLEASKAVLELAGKMEKIADSAATKALKLQERVDILEKERGSLLKKIEELEKKVYCIETERDNVKRWAERLCLQLKSHDIDPVRPVESSEKKKEK